MSKKEYIVGSGDVERFILYYIPGSIGVKFYFSHIGDDGDWFFTNDKYQAEVVDDAEAETVVDMVREKFGVELTIEEVGDDE